MEGWGREEGQEAPTWAKQYVIINRHRIKEIYKNMLKIQMLNLHFYWLFSDF